MELLLDISRTVARARHAQPTGIDRVERAYIDWALEHGGRFLCRLGGRLFEVPAPALRALLAWLDGQGEAPGADLRALVSWRSPPRLRRAHALVRRHGLPVPEGGPRPGGPGVYLNVGHDNLAASAMVALGQAGWRRAVLVHDTIPLDYPEFAAPGMPEKFRAKLAGVSRADAVICNSADTAGRLAGYLPDLAAPVWVLALGIAPAPVVPAAEPRAFVVLGTIEPRKNHRLLLDLWARNRPEAGPKLTIIGRRGWENRDVFRTLDSHPMMGCTVFETGPLDEAALAGHVGSAIALLFPSFAEGYGLPLAEALARGVPVIASDLPSLREVGGEVPDWLAPDDPDGWAAAIRAYAEPGSSARAAQIARMTDWRPPAWDTHFRGLGNLLETILVQADKGR